MPHLEMIYRVFVASPSDVKEERDLLEEVVNEINLSLSRREHARIHLVKWETDVYPGMSTTDGQSVIADQINDNYDIFLGILWARFGSPTSKASSGTEEEFDRALVRFKTNPDAIRIMFYFREGGPENLSAIDPDQLKAVNDFKKRLEGEGALYRSYRDVEDFRRLTSLHLREVITDWHDEVKKGGLTPNPFEAGAPHHGIGGQSSPTEAWVEEPSTLDADGEGFLELVDSATRQFEESTEIAVTLTTEITSLGNDFKALNEEIAQATGGDVNKKNVRLLREIVDRAAGRMMDFVSKVEAFLPRFSSSLNGALKSTGDAALLLPEFKDRGVDQIASALEMVVNMKTGVTSARAGVAEFRTAVAGMPPATTEMKRARRKTLALLDELDREWSQAIQIADDVERVLLDLASPDDVLASADD